MKFSRRLIDITGMRDIIQRRVPMLSLDSGSDGPVVWLTACIHGDEVGGTAIVHEVFRELRASGLQRGAVHALPLINSMGFENMSRYINAEREDLNRCFPGDPRGSMGQQLARRLFDMIVKTAPDLVVDLHNDWIHSVPYVLVEPAEVFSRAATRRASLAAARASGLMPVEDSETFNPLANTLTGALAGVGIPTVTLETGGAYGVIEKDVEQGKAAVLGMLARLGCIEFAGQHRGNGKGGELLHYSNQPLCSTSGLIRFAVAPGETVRSKQVLARVYSAFGSCEETLRAAGPGYVLGLRDHARVLPGEEVIAIAIAED